jgi:protein phosphatase
MVVEPSRGIVMVADGMGGAPGGDVASALAVQEVCRGLHDGHPLGDAFGRANDRILEMGDEKESLEGMGTTLTVLRLDAETGAYEVGHVGDSRAYRLAGDELIQLTRDQTLVADMVDAGTLSPAEARGHYLGHILSQALGTAEHLEVEILLGMAEAGDRFLLCTDGLLRVLEDEDLLRWLRESRSRALEGVVQGMVEEANRRGAPDNVTVAILTVNPGGKAL